jgi:UDP-N-acetylmuramoyl-L-alanyl-D-glutamate--2,6-diaminopimelate ligase
MQADMVSIDKQFAHAFDQSIKPLLGFFNIDAPDIMISGLALDSRDVAIHKAFIAIQGQSLDGRDFIPQAISLGAKVIMAECETREAHGHLEMREQSLIVSFYRLADSLSELAAFFYQFPANSLSVIAVTGTNGKTSTVQLISQLAHLLGETTASIGTLGAGLYQEPVELKDLNATINTTPDAISIQKLIANFVAEGVSQVALEASSHALVQSRINALKTDVAIFTNLTRDHLDYHHSMRQYGAAKRLLLKQPQLAYVLLNGDDPEYQHWAQEAPDTASIVLYGQSLAATDIPEGYQYCLAKNIKFTVSGMQFSVQSSWGNCELRVALMGQFNVNNVLAAISSQMCLGKSLKQITYLVQRLTPVPGRMELFTGTGQATIVVDYAHTPDALEKALIAARQHCSGKLYCIFGCGGDRDTGKRALMGEIAQRLADHITLTDDNVRNEIPLDIINDILSGCSQPELINIQHDRKLALETVANSADSGDIILIAGKGHENYQIIGDQRLPYDERQFVAQFQKEKTL